MKENFSLSALNTFGITVQAQYFAEFTDTNQLDELLAFSQSKSPSLAIPLILGGGSNILFTKDVAGLVVKNNVRGMERIHEDEDHVWVKAGAGEPWHELVLYCIEHNLAGMENLSLIPGNVGASPMQNIGAYGVELKDVFYQLEAYCIADKSIVSFGLTDCAFGYRESVFKNKLKNQFIITSVTYRLNKRPQFNIGYGAIEQELQAMGVQDLSLKAISQAVINIRSSKLPNPAELGNAGSFFKNPEVDAANFETLKMAFPELVGYVLDHGGYKLAAGWLIEQCGWKGFRKGDAGCHAKQALVLVNYGKATGVEILSLSEEIINSVYNKFSVRLQREVNIF